jgi:CubicO group peptidase (beta-lactamase class C family)
VCAKAPRGILLGLLARPGGPFSNTNWLLLARVVERVDGRMFHDFMEQEVFRSLRITSTLLRADPEVACGYRDC